MTESVIPAMSKPTATWRVMRCIVRTVVAIFERSFLEWVDKMNDTDSIRLQRRILAPFGFTPLFEIA